MCSVEMQTPSSSSLFEYRERYLLFGEIFLTTWNVTDSPVDPSDTMLPHYLIATWAKVCQAMGPEFEPYLPVVMPPLLRAASVKADVSIYGLFLL